MGRCSRPLSVLMQISFGHRRHRSHRFHIHFVRKHRTNVVNLIDTRQCLKEAHHNLDRDRVGHRGIGQNPRASYSILIYYYIFFFAQK